MGFFKKLGRKLKIKKKKNKNKTHSPPKGNHNIKGIPSSATVLMKVPTADGKIKMVPASQMTAQQRRAAANQYNAERQRQTNSSPPKGAGILQQPSKGGPPKGAGMKPATPSLNVV